MILTDDPLSDFDRYDRQQSEELKKRPVCCNCWQPIQEERLWDINGFLYCDECARDEFQKDTEDYIE
jgi:hypothetical protein